MQKKVIVSSCLLGIPCRYDGKDQKREFLVQLQKENPDLIISVCPEVLGGLPTPRVPCEKNGSIIISKEGKDETSAYQSGVEQAMSLIKGQILDSTTESLKAYLKSKSPMCGMGKIYDGNFTGNLVDGDGLFVEALKNANLGIQIESVD